MRIYEFSKKVNIPSKQLIEALHKKGFAVSNHMSSLDEAQISFLEKEFNLIDTVSNSLSTHEKLVSEKKEILSSQEKQKLLPETEQPEQPEKPAVKTEDSSGQILEREMSLGVLADQLNVPASDLIVMLLKEGLVFGKNQLLPKELVVELAQAHGKEVVKPQQEKKEILKKGVSRAVYLDKLEERYPVVVVTGHVDHGKTTLLDFIRKTRVAAREKGGITQHLGAYEAVTLHGKIIFLDTPGHEAFTKMRMRGVKVADIVVLVVAADDGIMPQTVEAIRHAKTMEVPIVVAINKTDKVDKQRIEEIKGQLTKYDLISEEWGGHTIVVPISAKSGTGVDQLLELLVLQAHMMELKADLSIAAQGYVLEAKMEKGRGVVATVICQHGTLKVGDYFVCGSTTGRVTALVDCFGTRVQQTLPSIPVQVSGFDALPQAGDFFEVVSAREFGEARVSKGKYRTPAARTLFNEHAQALIIKADTNSSKEAIVDAIERICASETKENKKEFYIVHAGIGDISESDVLLAQNTRAQIFGFNVKIDKNASELAQGTCKISLFQIIYKLLEHVQELMKQEEVVPMVLTKIGEAVVRKVFDIKKVGVIAGSYVKEGNFVRDGIVKAWRGRQFLGEGQIKSLQREKRSVKEVHAGYECGFIVEGITDWHVDDRAECYIKKPLSTSS